MEWHLRQVWQPLLFEDEELAVDRRQRDPVAPARASAAARLKKKTHVTSGGLPVQSFRTLLTHLGRVQSRQCQEFCGISGLFSARTPLSSFFKVRCYVSICDRAAAGPHSASRRVDPDPSAAPRLRALGSPAPRG